MKTFSVPVAVTVATVSLAACVPHDAKHTDTTLVQATIDSAEISPGDPGSPDNPLTPGGHWVVTSTDSVSGTTWETSIFGIIETSPQAAGGPDIQCYAILGVTTPTDIADGAEVTPPEGEFRITALYDGQGLPSASDCDVQELEDLGYSSIRFAEIPRDHAYPFYFPYLVSTDAESRLEVIIFESTALTWVYVEPTILEDAPRPPTP